MQHYNGLTNSEINERIRERIHNKLYRRIMRLKLIDGLTCEKIAEDVQRGFDNQNLQAQTRDILSAVTGGTAQTIAASTQNAQNAIQKAIHALGHE